VAEHLLLQVRVCLFDLLRLLADGARHPVSLAEAVDHRAPYPPGSIGFELQPAAVIEFLDRIDQTHDAVAGEIVLGHILRQPDRHPVRHILHKRQVMLDQPFFRLDIAVLFPLLPQFEVGQTGRLRFDHRPLTPFCFLQGKTARAGLRGKSWPVCGSRRPDQASASCPDDSRFA